MLQPLGRVALAFLPIFLVACSGKATDENAPPAPADPNGEAGAGNTPSNADPNGEAGAGNTPSNADPNGYCGSETPTLIAAAGDPADPVAPLTEEPVDGSMCNAVERSYPPESRTHVTLCTVVDYDANPPAGGDHYALFPKFGVYDYPIPREFWVHSLEHGGVVFTYSCTDCADEVAAVTALMAQNQPDPSCCTATGCPSDATNQLSLVPDPGIPTRWAASSWDFTLTTDCFEADVFQNFIDEHRDSALAPESPAAVGTGICANTYATDPTLPVLH